MPELQTTANPMIYVLKILSINKQSELKMRGGNMNINEFFLCAFLATNLPQMAGRSAGFLLKVGTSKPSVIYNFPAATKQVGLFVT